MADDSNPAAPTPGGDGNPDPTNPDPTATVDPDLGEGGQKALAAERKARSDAEKANKALQAKLDKLTADNQTEMEKALAAARDEGTASERARSNKVAIAAAVKVAAGDKLADPEDALAFLDLDSFDVADDGTVDSKTITSAIDELVENKPHLAKGGATPPRPGSGGGGARPQAGIAAPSPILASLQSKLGISPG